MTVRLLVGDCRKTLPTLEPGSVQAVVTSPPYYGLRDYGLPPLVWGGDAKHAHEWDTTDLETELGKGNWAQGVNGRGELQPGGVSAKREPLRAIATTGCCPCGAWLGSLGLEPTPDLFVEHLVEVFSHVKRVLRDDGVLWLNLGDSYAGSGNGAHDYRERAKSKSLSLNPDKYLGQSPAALQRVGPQEHTEGAGRVPGLKPKDLMMMPFRVAMALQADGWWLRSVIPWLKRNSMPESVTDRPATSVEYVFLLAKSARYFWDADAVRMAQSENTHARGSGHTPKERPMGEGIKANASFHAATNRQWLPNGRNRRNSDWFFESWQGLLLDEQDDPLALAVNPAPFSGAHFATFPAKLVEPMVKASTRPGDTLLDPFAGAGTVGLVADRLQRNAVLCELKPSYAEMGTERITQDAPMFSEVVA